MNTNWGLVPDGVGGYNVPPDLAPGVDLAIEAAYALFEAYGDADPENGGSSAVDWEQLNAAHATAAEAMEKLGVKYERPEVRSGETDAAV